MSAGNSNRTSNGEGAGDGSEEGGRRAAGDTPTLGPESARGPEANSLRLWSEDGPIFSDQERKAREREQLLQVKAGLRTTGLARNGQGEYCELRAELNGRQASEASSRALRR